MDHSHALHSGDHYLQAADARTGHVDGLAGVWKLGAGRALRVHAGQSGVLRIAHGRVWATFDDAGNDDRSRAGDHFLSRGESLPLQPGQTLVMESFGVGHASSAYFSWEPALDHGAQAAFVPTGWKTSAVQPMADLRQAAGLVGRAIPSLGASVVAVAARSVEVVLTGFAMIFVASRASRAACGNNRIHHA